MNKADLLWYVHYNKIIESDIIKASCYNVAAHEILDHSGVSTKREVLIMGDKNPKNKEKMMKILRSAFDEYFDD